MAEQVRMPRLSQTMTSGRLVEWLKSEGEELNAGEPLAVVESDKAEVEIEAGSGGVLRKVLVAPGEEVPVGAPLAIVGAADEDISSLLPGQARAAAPAATEESPAPAQAPAAAPAAAPAGRQPVSPAARRVARELGVDVTQVTGSGEGGLVTEKDVRAFAAQQAQPAAQVDEDVEVIPLTGVRRRIAERMALSRHTAADVTTVAEVDVTDVAAARRALGVSYTAFVAWAVAQSLREFPILNASLVEDRILVKKNIHLGIAVAAEQGLVVPVVRDADRKSVEEISKEIDDLAARAREGKLMPDALTGSTFSITNSGAFGSLFFTPIINQPEVAVLGMGKVADTPVVRDGAIVARKIMYLCLSYDHRVVDGAPAVQFLQAVKHRLEQVSSSGQGS